MLTAVSKMVPTFPCVKSFLLTAVCVPQGSDQIKLCPLIPNVTLYGEMCVSDGKASMPITCRTSSNCPPSAWLKCFLACLKHTKEAHKLGKYIREFQMKQLSVCVVVQVPHCVHSLVLSDELNELLDS